MQGFQKFTTMLSAGLLLATGTHCQAPRKIGQWNIQPARPTHSALSWAPFTWAGMSMGGRYFEKAAMLIPAKVDGLPYDFVFQFDLGATVTLLNGNTLTGIVAKHPAFNRTTTHINHLFKFWQPTTAFEDLSLTFGATNATTRSCYVMRKYGEKVSSKGLNAGLPINLGSIGADLFQNRILVIDYPNRRFAICDTLPASLHTTFTKIALLKDGRVILPLQLANKSYKVMFDNGCSVFSLITGADKVNNFSTAAPTDTLSIRSWGITHDVIGRPVKEAFELVGQRFSDVTVYADFRPSEKDTDYDAITGNALFWDKTIIIDFKKKEFGVK
ncbi:hypothetical protein [Hymenobacter arizonensis]|uniref:Aspartyl protease n=1 Tax=Hymenobacter arizonensis TaxID=1227077 RepID=A0A1I6BD53_HYMAR|nr:hypothetical protein [Hymenobacter arizonensis]SFQ78858.1 hypothetical protein SAMN04515668_4370 [Hymenobacter arizonensis]